MTDIYAKYFESLGNVMLSFDTAMAAESAKIIDAWKQKKVKLDDDSINCLANVLVQNMADLTKNQIIKDLTDYNNSIEDTVVINMRRRAPAPSVTPAAVVAPPKKSKKRGAIPGPQVLPALF